MVHSIDWRWLRRCRIVLLLSLLLLAGGWWATQPTGLDHQISTSTGLIRISPDGRYLATAGFLVDRVSGKPIRVLAYPGEHIFSANSHYLVVRQEQWIDIYTIDPASAPIRHPIPTSNVQAIAIGSSGTFLVLADLSGVRIYELSNQALTETYHIPMRDVNAVQLSLDDRYVIARGQVRQVIDVQTGQVVVTDPTYRGASILTPQSYQQIIGYHDGTVGYFVTLPIAPPLPPTPVHQIRTPEAHPDGYAMSPDERYLVIVGYNSVGSPPLWGPQFFPGPDYSNARMTLIRATDGAVVQRFAGPPASIRNPTFTADGQYIMTIGPGQGLGYWRVQPQEPWEQTVRSLPFWLAPVALLAALLCRMRRRRAAKMV